MREPIGFDKESGLNNEVSRVLDACFAQVPYVIDFQVFQGHRAMINAGSLARGTHQRYVGCIVISGIWCPGHDASEMAGAMCADQHKVLERRIAVGPDIRSARGAIGHNLLGAVRWSFTMLGDR